MIERNTFLMIPMERIGVLIGEKGSVKKKIEKKFNISIDIDGKTGSTKISLNKNSNPANLFRSKDIIMAVSRGFSPDNAFKLFEENALLGIIDLRDYFGSSKSDIKRIKGRIIGKNGRMRQTIEDLSGVNICVYGHTVAFIGKIGQFDIAKSAIFMLIEGKKHNTVYGFLEKKRSELKKMKVELWETKIK